MRECIRAYDILRLLLIISFTLLQAPPEMKLALHLSTASVCASHGICFASSIDLVRRLGAQM